MVSDMVLVDRDSPRRSSDYIALGYLECTGNLFSSDECQGTETCSPGHPFAVLFYGRTNANVTKHRTPSWQD